MPPPVSGDLLSRNNETTNDRDARAEPSFSVHSSNIAHKSSHNRHGMIGKPFHDCSRAAGNLPAELVSVLHMFECLDTRGGGQVNGIPVVLLAIPMAD
jgi:hypothetical protein